MATVDCTRLVTQERDGTQTIVSLPGSGDHLLRDHLNENVQRAVAFQVRFTGGDAIPQGSTVDSLTLSFATGFGDAGGDNYKNLYAGIINNLDTEAGGTHDLTTTFTHDVWRFLSGDNGGVGGLGARVGLTHNHVNGLDEPGPTDDGFTPMDEASYVYRAFAAAVPSYSTVTTVDIAGALQPLVSDAGWDSDDQTITIVLFWDSSDWDGAYQWNSNDMHSGLTWASGDSGWGNANANSPNHANQNMQVRVTTTTPYVTYEVSLASLPFSSGKSLSLGRAATREAVSFGRWHGDSVEQTNKEAFMPKLSAGRGDLPPTDMNTANPLGVAWGLWADGSTGSVFDSATRLDDAQLPDATRRPPGTASIRQDDYLGQSPTLNLDADFWQETYDAPLRCASGVLYCRYSTYPDTFGNFWPKWLRAYRGGGLVWEIAGSNDTGSFTTFRPRLNVSGVAATAYDSQRLVNGTWWRFHWQMVCDPEPILRVRAYDEDGSTVVWEAELTDTELSGADLSFDELRFGIQGNTNKLCHVHVHDIECWTDFYGGGAWLDGDPGEPYTPQEWAWAEWDGAQAEMLDDLGTVASIDPDGTNVVMTSPADPLTLEAYELEVWNPPGSPVWTKTSDLPYGFGNRQVLDLYVPTATAPNYGWPIILWAHGGFGLSGDKGDIPEGFVTEAALNGWAVASVNYVLSHGDSIENVPPDNGVYPAWNANADTARYPTQALDMKLAAIWLGDKGTVLSGGNGDYDIRGDQIVATGESFGGWPAMAAALTRELTDDGQGVDLTLAGNTALGYPNEPDPTFLAAYTWAGPVDWWGAMENDPTDGAWNLLNTGRGNVISTVWQFMGAGIANTKPSQAQIEAAGIDSLLLANAARAVPVRWAGGYSDFLVPCSGGSKYPASATMDHAQALEDAFSAAVGLPAGADFEAIRQHWSVHHLAMADYPAAAFHLFLDGLT